MHLRGFALPAAEQIVAAVADIVAAAPFRTMCTPWGLPMSVAMTNCGTVGWISDRSGYRYAATDPLSGKLWPAMPTCFTELATAAACAADYLGFTPDACLINRYEPGTQLSLHQDKDERDYNAPVVSVSLGIPAIFLFGGQRRRDRAQRVLLTHGDVVVWGGPSRLNYHGVLRLKEDYHPLLGSRRINLTFRKAM